MREPTIVRWPGRIEPGSQCDAIAGTTDILPTLVSMAGGMLNPDIKIDGKDITDLLLGKTKVSPHQAWYYFKGNQLQAIRSGQWKLAITPQTLGMGIREKPADLMKAGPRLYNLDDEIGEVTDVASLHPSVVIRLQKMAEAMRLELGSPGPASGVRPPGRVENPVTLYPTRERKKRKK